MMKGGLGNLMRQAQQMQETMQKAQAELAEIEVTGESGAGHGQGDDEWSARGKKSPDRAEIARLRTRTCSRTLLTAAINDAVRKVAARTQEKYCRPHVGHELAARNEAAVLRRCTR